MRILPEPIEFEWDQGNLDKNWIKHKVTNQEAEQIFKNSPKFIFRDASHSTLERRYMIWGVTNDKRKLSVFFTMRKKFVRIISARDMSKKERIAYENKKEKI